MAAENFTYTGSPWGYTAPGWTVFQRSPGISPKVAESMMPYFRYTGPANGPVRFVYVGETTSGTRLLSQSLDCGLRWYDESRGHDYFAHVFVESSSTPLPAGFNPLSIFQSHDLQTAFPEDLKKKAQDILKGLRAKEEPPLLEAPASIAELSVNPAYDRTALFDAARLPSGVVAKIASVAERLAAKIAHPDGSPILFDLSNPCSLDVMAVSLALLPPSLRHRVSFSTFAVPGEMGATSPLASFTFVGVPPQGRESDRDTGVIGELPSSGFSFKNVSEIKQFAQIADGVEEDLPNVDAFAMARLYFEVVTGRITDDKSVDEAAALARKNPALRQLGGTGIADRLGRIEYEERLAGIRTVDDAIRFIKEMGVRKFKGADMAKDVADKLGFSGISENEALRLIEAFKASGLSDREVFGKAVAAASEKVVAAQNGKIVELKGRLSRREKELEVARRSTSSGGIGKMVAIVLAGVLIGALLCGFFAKTIHSKSREEFQAVLSQMKDNNEELNVRIKKLEQTKDEAKSELKKIRAENEELKASQKAPSQKAPNTAQVPTNAQPGEGKSPVQISPAAEARKAVTVKPLDDQISRLQAEINELRQQIQKLKAEKADVETTKEKFLKSNDHYQKALAQKDKELSNATNELAKIRADYSMVTRTNSELRARLAKSEKEKDEIALNLSKDPKARESALDKKASELKKKSETLEKREGKLNADEKELGKKQEQLDDEQKDLKAKQKEQEKKERALNASKTALDQREEQLKQREKAVAKKESGLEEAYRKKEAALEQEYQEKEKERKSYYDERHRELDQKLRTR